MKERSLSNATRRSIVKALRAFDEGYYCYTDFFESSEQAQAYHTELSQNLDRFSHAELYSIVCVIADSYRADLHYVDTLVELVQTFALRSIRIPYGMELPSSEAIGIMKREIKTRIKNLGIIRPAVWNLIPYDFNLR